MKIRSAYGALCAAVALTAGLVVSTGTAFADTASCTNAQASVTSDQQKLNVDQARLSNDPATIPDPANPGQVKTNPAVAADQAAVNSDRGQLASDQSAVAIACGSTTTSTPTPSTTPAPTTTPTPTPCVDPVTGAVHHRHCRDNDGDELDGHILLLNGVGSLDVCGYGNFDLFAGRYSNYRTRLGYLLGNNPYSGFNEMHALCGNQTTVVGSGQCVTYRTNAVRYGNDLNLTRRSFNDLVIRYRLAHDNNDALLTQVEIDQLRRERALELARLNQWDSAFTQLRTVCSDPNPPVQIITEQPVPAPVVTAPPVPAAAPEAAPAPLTGSGHYRYPSSAPDTGDGSLAGR